MKKAKNVDEYILNSPAEVQSTLKNLRTLIKKLPKTLIAKLIKARIKLNESKVK